MPGRPLTLAIRAGKLADQAEALTAAVYQAMPEMYSELLSRVVDAGGVNRLPRKLQRAATSEPFGAWHRAWDGAVAAESALVRLHGTLCEKAGVDDFGSYEPVPRRADDGQVPAGFGEAEADTEDDEAPNGDAGLAQTEQDAEQERTPDDDEPET